MKNQGISKNKFNNKNKVIKVLKIPKNRMKISIFLVLNNNNNKISEIQKNNKIRRITINLQMQKMKIYDNY